MKKRGTLMLAAALVLCGCGKDDNNQNNTNNNTVNNSSNTPNNSNNTSNTPNNSNNTSNTPNNTTSTNNGTNGTNNNTTPPYTPVEFSCDAITPAGTIDDLVGTWETTDSCIGADPYEPLYAICAGAIVSRADILQTTGFVRINADYSYVNTATFDIEADIWIPGECTAQIGGGDCAATESTFLALFEAAGADVTLTCSDDAAGGCFCTAAGPATVSAIGIATSSADGMLTLNEFDSDGMAVQYDWQFEIDGDTVHSQAVADGTRYTATRNGAATDCDVYCAGFLANCNDVTGVTGYDDNADCLAQCAGFTVAGSEQTSGDSLECRMYHLFVSADTSDAGNQDTHCPHAQATATAPCSN